MYKKFVAAGDLEPRVTLGIFLPEFGQEHEPELLDMALRRIGQVLPGFRVIEFSAHQRGQPLRIKEFSERKWRNVLALSAANKLAVLNLGGRGEGDAKLSESVYEEFDLTCTGRGKFEPYVPESCLRKIRVISVEVRMLRESWKIADTIADTMKEVALYAASNLKLLQAYVSLTGVADWNAEYLQRYVQRPVYVQAEMSTDYIVVPAWFCIVNTWIMSRINDYGNLSERFETAVVRSDERGKATHISIQLAPRITEVGASELRAFRDLVL